MDREFGFNLASARLTTYYPLPLPLPPTLIHFSSTQWPSHQGQLPSGGLAPCMQHENLRSPSHPSSSTSLTPPRELFSSARHHLGIYRCVVVTARYQIPLGTDPIPAVTSAVAALVRDQPFLRVGILDEDTATPTFSHLTEVDLGKHIEWREADAATPDEYDAEVARTQGWLHDQFFPEMETRSPWKMLCLRPRDAAVQGASNQVVDIFFAYHHALTDGTGGREFHQHLLAALQQQQQQQQLSPLPGTQEGAVPSQTLLSFPEPPHLPEAQEDAIPFRNSYLYLLRTAWTMLAPAFLKPRKPPIWAGADVDFSTPYVTRIRPLFFSSEQAQRFVAASRSHKSTLTTALHGVILASLVKRLSAKEAQSFLCTTPISLRPWMKEGADEAVKGKLRTMVTGHVFTFTPKQLAPFRAPGADVDALIWQNGERIKLDLMKRVATMPADEITSLLPMVPDFIQYWRVKDGIKREATWEISNVGVISAADSSPSSSVNDSSTRWRHVSAIFTNGAMVAGAGIGVNVISVEGGVLTIAISWQETVVAEELVEGLASDITNFIQDLQG